MHALIKSGQVSAHSLWQREVPLMLCFWAILALMTGPNFPGMDQLYVYHLVQPKPNKRAVWVHDILASGASRYREHGGTWSSIQAGFPSIQRRA